MLIISQITTDPLQQQQVTLPDGSVFTLTTKFVPMQYGWFITELSYVPKSFVLQGLRITASPNMLNQWRNLLPFGLGCFCAGNREPSQQEDFSSGAARLFVLSDEECNQYVELLANG